MNDFVFRYFQAPAQNIARLVPNGKCTFCGDNGPCFDLKESRQGCFDCLQRGRFHFWHETEIGLLDSEKGLCCSTRSQERLARGFKRMNFGALLKTPKYVTWQGERWLVHCDDFMIYLGEWLPADFQMHAPDGDGRKLFMEMVAAENADVWDSTTPTGATEPAGWYFQVHVFRCTECGKLRAHFDVP